MHWTDIDSMFQRAFQYSFTKKKFLFTYPLVALCGVFISIFHSMSNGCGGVLKLSLSFFPVFFTSSCLLAAGIVLVRAYHNEIKKISFSYRDLMRKSWDLIVASTYITLPLSMAYVTLWSVIGLFYVLKEIPWIGTIIGLILSFIPFLLVLSLLALAIFTVSIVFFLAPKVALECHCSLQLVKELIGHIGARVLSHLTLLILALLPVAFFLGVFFFAGALSSYSWGSSSSLVSRMAHLSVMSLAFSALCTPIVVFFFNFSAESYVYLKKRRRA